MSLASIFKHTDHRPWPHPKGPWIMTQTWNDLLFAHWPMPPEDLRRIVPEALTLDTYEGQAWVGVVPFEISQFRPRWIPPIPGLSIFPEMNVRTYVIVDNKPGVFFFSLDAASWPAVIGARRWFHLPYFYAEMSIQRSGDWVAYSSIRKHPGASPGEFKGRYSPISSLTYAPPGTLPHWLTERYCLYAVGPCGQVIRGEIHHVQWPLQAAALRLETNTLSLPGGLPVPNSPPLLHYARQLTVAMWPPVRV